MARQCGLHEEFRRQAADGGSPYAGAVSLKLESKLETGLGIGQFEFLRDVRAGSPDHDLARDQHRFLDTGKPERLTDFGFERGRTPGSRTIHARASLLFLSNEGVEERFP
ncbi:MAG: hypothetical protein WD069_12615 [Planctomycetales bacterium]